MTAPQNPRVMADDIDAAALQWCGEKERETSLDDIRYFQANWEALPGLRSRVEAFARHREAAEAAAKAEVERMREALENIANPIAYLQREAVAKGRTLGPHAYSIATDVGFLQGIARAALTTGDVMSKTGNMRVEIQETEDYRFGWESAERGDPRPEWEAGDASARLAAQRLGWDDYHNQERSA